MNPPLLRRRLVLLPGTLGLGLSLGLLGGCATAGKTDPAAPPPVAADVEATVDAASAPAEPEAPGAAVTDPEAQFHIMTGELAASRHQPGVAATEFLAALRTVDDPALAARATGLAIASGNGALVEALTDRWLELAPNESEPREVLLQLAVQRGDVDAVCEQAEVLINGDAGGRSDGFRQVALLLIQQPARPELATAALQRLTAKYPRESGAYYASALVALRYNRTDDAEAAARQAVKLDPDSRDNELLLVGVLAKQRKFDEADALHEEAVRRHGKDRDDLRLAYVKLLLEAGERDRARTQLQRLLKESPKNRDALYALAVFNANDGKLDEARKQFAALTSDPDRGSDAHFQLGRVYERQRNYDAALREYAAVSGGQQSLDAAVRRAAVLAHLDRVDEARQILIDMRDQFPPLGKRLMMAEGEMLLDAGRTDDALATYNDALKRAPGDDDLLYGRSLVYDRMGRAADSEADLRKIIAEQPDDARALNALGYLLAVNGGKPRLTEAQDLIGRALKLNPDDAAIIDSMGWVTYKLGQAENARGYLQQAYDKTPDPEIAAHLGEVLWVLGQHDQASAVWQQALNDNPGHRTLIETMKRLNP